MTSDDWQQSLAAVAADYLSRAHFLKGFCGALAYLGVIAVGGLILSSVTGLCLAQMFRRETAFSYRQNSGCKQ